jgi:hypothetical protein
MESTAVDHAVEFLEKANADLEPELSMQEARRLLKSFVRADRLAAFGIAALARSIDDASELARVTGTSMGKAKDTIATAQVLHGSGELNDAMRHGEVSLEQATEIASAERSSPGAARELLPVARDEAFHVLREKARTMKLEAEQNRDLAERQRSARLAGATATSSAGSYPRRS